ncbi:MAG: thioesterase family protein [Anaerolineales bacterium]
MIDAPLALHTATARPEWIDYNGHLMDGYYLVAFTFATEALLDYLGFGLLYRERTGCTIYTVEAHVNFLREVHANAGLRYTTQLLGFDAKRIQVFHHMFHAEEGYLAATNELMFLHVNQSSSKVESMPPDRLARLEQVYAAHTGLPRPAQAGRSIKQLP